MREADIQSWEEFGVAGQVGAALRVASALVERPPACSSLEAPPGGELPSLATLRILEALSRHKRVGVAANELGLSHAAVSQALTRLELKCGRGLFNRTSRGLDATPACEALIGAYLAASAGLRRALAEVTEDRRRHALIPPTAWRWLSPTASRLRSSFPNVSIHACQEKGTVDLASADFAILPGDQLPAAGFERTPLYDERLLPVCSPGLAAQARIETPARLAHAPLLVERPELWRRWFAHAGLAMAPDLAGPIIDDSSLALEAALRGQGVALCCSLGAAAAIAQGDLVAPVDVSVSSGRRWWAVWREDGAADKTAMGILEWCLAELHAIKSRHVDLV